MTATDKFVAAGLRPGTEFQVAPLPDEQVFGKVKRVAMFAEAFLPKIDGVSKTAVIVARHLQQTGREVLIFAPDNGGHTPSHLGPSRVITLPSWEMPFVRETKVGFPHPVVNNELDGFRPDLIQLFSPAVMSLSGLWYGRNNDVPVLANYQSDLPGYARQYGFGFFSQPIKEGLKSLHNASHLTLVPSHTVIRELHAWGFERMVLWGRGVDTIRFSPEHATPTMRERLLAGRDDESIIVLYVGRLAQEKRLDLLRRVAKLERVALTIVGDGEERANLESYFGDDVHFTGYLFGEELAQAYASADLFAFTGTNETFGQVVTEAMASGLPVLVPNAGGVVDLVLDGMNGYVCQVDPADYERRVIEIRDDAILRAKLAENARAYALTRPWEAVMGDLERYYEKAWDLNEERIFDTPGPFANFEQNGPQRPGFSRQARKSTQQ